MAVRLLPDDIRELYEVHEWRHACAVLQGEFPGEWQDIIDVLREFRLRRSQILTPGGAKTTIAGGLDQGFCDRGWVEKGFATRIVVDTHEWIRPLIRWIVS
jgi:hypothetical protein